MNGDALLDGLLEIAELAGASILRAYDQGFEVSYKGPDDPVTTADKEANRIICAELARRFPAAPIVAEESHPDSYRDYTRAVRSWFVDPIDGTKEFIARTDEFVVMIGLAEQGKASTGIVYSPTHRTAWMADTRGAFVVRDGQRRSIHPSGTNSLGQATLLASRSHDQEEALRVARELGVGKVQSVGSAGLKGAMVAEGTADLYISPGRAGKRWDACAIDAILCAAGGTLTDTYGHVLDYAGADLNNEAGLLATNGALLQQAVERLKQLRAPPAAR